MSDTEPALFRAFPELAEHIPRRPFVAGPTPVRPLPLEGMPADALFVKCDGASCPLYGGNKPRKLEFVIGAAAARRARRLVTTGGLGTHHGLATTILGRAAGLATTLVLVDQPVTDEVLESLTLQAAYGAEQIHCRGVPGAALAVIRVLARSTLRGERTQLVPTGGTNARGTLGFVSAGLEVAEQIRRGELPVPAEVFLPVGSGGTFAGLVLGLKLAGLPTRVRGVLVTDILPPSPRRLASIARSSLRLLRRHSQTVRAVPIEAADFPLIRDQLGGGYGAPTDAAREALARAAEHGIQLETTYSAKCFAALLARGPEPPGGPILFWNTYNGIDVAAAAPRQPERGLLPLGIRRAVERGARKAA